jgi:hypothetical protein
LLDCHALMITWRYTAGVGFGSSKRNCQRLSSSSSTFATTQRGD